jgi:hypothetical protein
LADNNLDTVLIVAAVLFGIGLILTIFSIWIAKPKFDAGITKYLGDSIWAKTWKVIVGQIVEYRVIISLITGLIMILIAMWIVIILWGHEYIIY